MEKLDCVIHRLVYGISSFIRLSNSAKNGSSTCHRSFGMLLLTSVGSDGSVVQTQAAFFLESLVAFFLWLFSKTEKRRDVSANSLWYNLPPMELSGWQICKFLNQSRLLGIDTTSTPSKWRCDTPYKVLRKRMGRKKERKKVIFILSRFVGYILKNLDLH